jgi:predicted nucleic acid-binding protein
MAKTKSATVVVCDAGPVIHLDEVGFLQLLEDFNRVIVPDTVQQEIQNHRDLSFEGPNIAWSLAKPSFPLDASVGAVCKLFSLDAGEVEALNLMQNQPGAIFLTDDAAARIVASKLGYRVHGTIGVLVRAIRRDFLTPEEVADALMRIREIYSLYIKDSLLEDVRCKVLQLFK